MVLHVYVPQIDKDAIDEPDFDKTGSRSTRGSQKEVSIYCDGIALGIGSLDCVRRVMVQRREEGTEVRRCCWTISRKLQKLEVDFLNLAESKIAHEQFRNGVSVACFGRVVSDGEASDYRQCERVEGMSNPVHQSGLENIKP